MAALGSGPHCLGQPPGPLPGPPTCHGPPSALRAARCSPAPAGLPGHPADLERTAPQEGAGGPGRDFEAFLPCSQGGPRLSLPPTRHRVRLQGAQPLPPAHSCLLTRGFLSHCHPGWVICPPRSPICTAHKHTQAPAPTCGPFPEPHARPCAQGQHGSSARWGLGSKGLFPKGPPESGGCLGRGSGQETGLGRGAHVQVAAAGQPGLGLRRKAQETGA